MSVIVAAYNEAACIEACIQSLLALRWPYGEVELLLIDNASSDGTGTIMRRYASRAVVLEEPRRGPAAARNCGLRHARAPLLAMTDADCTVAPDWLLNLLAPLEDPAVGAVGGRVVARQPCNAVEAFDESVHDMARAVQEIPPYLATENFATRRDVIERVGLFDEHLLRGEDVDLSYRLNLAGYRLAYAGDASVTHEFCTTLRQLFREGFGHGVWAVPVRQKHAYVRHTRVHLPGYLSLWRDAVTWVMTGSPRALCSACFNLGKKLGRIYGSLRFGTVDL